MRLRQVAFNVRKAYRGTHVLFFSVRLKPELPHRLTRVELQKKMQHNDFWLAYIRSLQSKPKQDTADWHEYELSQSKLGEYGGECGKIVRRNKEPLASTSFYPLAPRLLYNVKITPKSIRLRKVRL